MLGGETDGTLDLEVLVLGAPDEISADCRGHKGVSWTDVQRFEMGIGHKFGLN